MNILKEFLELDVPESMCNETKIFVHNWFMGMVNPVIEIYQQRMRDGSCLVSDLRSEIQQMHKDYGCEFRDPNGTIWDYAKTLQVENEELKAKIKNSSRC